MKSWHLAAALGLFSAQIIQSQVILGPIRLPMSLLKLENKPQTHRDQHQDLNKAAGKKAMYERLTSRDSVSALEWKLSTEAFKALMNCF